MVATPRFGFETIAGSSTGEVIFADDLFKIEVLIQVSVENANVDSPPGSPTAGHMYIIGTSPTGAWAGKSKNLTMWDGAQWLFRAPVEGLRAYNKTNKNTHMYTSGGTWETIMADKQRIETSVAWDPASLNDGTQTTNNITVTGAALGDYVEAISFSLDLQGLVLTAYVSATNTVTAVLNNETGGTIDLGSGTVRVIVRKA